MTLRELVAMAEARQESDWARTCEVLAMIYNVNIDPRKTRTITGVELNPFVSPKRRKAAVPRGRIEDLKALL